MATIQDQFYVYTSDLEFLVLRDDNTYRIFFNGNLVRIVEGEVEMRCTITEFAAAH